MLFRSWDEYGEISGIYAPLPDRCEIVQYNGTPFLRYDFAWGEKASVELSYCGIMNRFAYKNDFFGESNRALLPTSRRDLARPLVLRSDLCH